MWQVAGDIDDRGVGALLDDLQAFARRRPGAFLLGAAALGFGLGRLAKASRAEPEPEVDFDEVDGPASGRGNGRGTPPVGTRQFAAPEIAR